MLHSCVIVIGKSISSSYRSFGQMKWWFVLLHIFCAFSYTRCYTCFHTYKKYLYLSCCQEKEKNKLKKKKKKKKKKNLLNGPHTHITKTRLFKYTENFPTKNENFRVKITDNVHISAQNIDCEYSLEPPRRGGSNEYPQSMFLSRNKEMMYTPVNPRFTI